MTDEKKPREFFIEMQSETLPEDYIDEVQEGDVAEDGLIHVIEKRAYDKLESKLAILESRACQFGSTLLNTLRCGEKLEAEHNKLKASVRGLIEALEFYSSTNNWTSLSSRVEYDLFQEDDCKHVVTGEDEQGVIAVKMAGSKGREALAAFRKYHPEFKESE